MVAEDIVEDLFVKLWNKMGEISTIHSIKSYLYTMARNGALTWIEKNKNERARYQNLSVITDQHEDKILDNMIYAEMMAKIYSAMEKLPEQCRRVFTLHYIEGKKISEIAQELKISTGSVFTHKYRGLQMVQKAISGLFILFFSLAFAWPN